MIANLKREVADKKARRALVQNKRMPFLKSVVTNSATVDEYVRPITPKAIIRLAANVHKVLPPIEKVIVPVQEVVVAAVEKPKVVKHMPVAPVVPAIQKITKVHIKSRRASVVKHVVDEIVDAPLVLIEEIGRAHV